jgi:hypothetical protein
MAHCLFSNRALEALCASDMGLVCVCGCVGVCVGVGVGVCV